MASKALSEPALDIFTMEFPISLPLCTTLTSWLFLVLVKKTINLELLYLLFPLPQMLFL